MRQVKPAKDYIPTTGYSDHSLHDAKSLAMHTVIAYKISKDPSLRERIFQETGSFGRRFSASVSPGMTNWIL